MPTKAELTEDIVELKNEIEELKKDKAHLTAQIKIYTSPYMEKYKNMSAEQLAEVVQDLRNVPFTEMLFIITVIIPELLYTMQLVQSLEKDLDVANLKVSEVYPDAS